MIQNTIKVLTVGFFISMITGFVLYRSGYFEASDPISALHTSPNGGELNNTNQVPDSTKTEKVNQQNANEIMPSSKSIAPVFDLEKYEQKKKQEMMPSSKSSVPLFDIGNPEPENPYVHSSKSMIHPIQVELTPNQVSEKKRQQLKVQPELEPIDSSSISVDSTLKQEAGSDQEFIDAGSELKSEMEKPQGISWGLIGLGVLGILFVGIGSIVYFKKKSK